MLEQLFSTLQKSEIKPIAHAALKSKLKWIKDENMKYKIIKLLEINRRKALGSGLSKDFLDKTPKVQSV